MMSTRCLTAALALTTSLIALPALAQAHRMSVDDALRIARANGLATITKVELDDGEWEVEGRNGAGQRLEVDIDATSGNIIRTERD